LIAAVLILHIVLLSVRVARNYRTMGELVRPTIGLVTLIVFQLLLGASTWVVNYGWPAWFQNYDWAERHVIVQESLGQAAITTAHVAAGSLIFVTAVLIALRSFRFVRGPAGSLAWRATAMGVAA
jgi:heme A synthase